MVEHVSPFILRIEEVFRFETGVVVLVGYLESGSPLRLAPSEVELVVDGRSHGRLQLDAERMPGSVHGRRAVETRANVDPEILRGADAKLVRD